MIDLQQLGLDKHMLPTGTAPVSRDSRGNFVTGMDFNTNFDRDVITGPNIKNASITNAKIGNAAIGTAQIGTLTFNQISGGTVNLGGTINGNGLLSLKNSSGSQILSIDNKGIVITGQNNLLFGTNASTYLSIDSSNRFAIIALDRNMIIETDTGTLTIFTNSRFDITIGSSNLLLVKSDAGGTLMRLTGSNGNLDIKGALGTGIAF